MKRSKLFIKWLKTILKGAWFVNLVLAGGAIGFQILNIIRPTKLIAASYLGKFKIELKFPGNFQIHNGALKTVFFQDLTGSPDLIMKSQFHSLFVLIFTLLIISITLYYNFHLWKLFEGLHQSAEKGTPFQLDIVKRLKKMSIVSVIIFAGGSFVSLIKYIFIRRVMVGGVLLFEPVYDNQLLNFLWVGILLYILANVFNAGLVLQEEHDLTI